MIIKLFDFENVNLDKLKDFLESERNWIEREYNKSINDCKIAIFEHYWGFYSGVDALERQKYLIYNAEPEDLGATCKNHNIITLKNITI